MIVRFASKLLDLRYLYFSCGYRRTTTFGGSYTRPPLKRHYPKTQIIIWADNDWQKADRTTKFGRVLGNTGLIQANRTAFKLRGTLVCTPDFSTFDSELIKEATDFNDLHRLDRLNRLVSTIPNKPDIHLSLWHELRHFNQHAHGAMAPSQFRDGVKHSYNSRYWKHPST